MPRSEELVKTPPPVRALRTIKGARLALARLYHQVSLGEVDPAVAGKLTHILSVLIGSARAHEFDQRLTEIEADARRGVKPNGHARRPRRGCEAGRREAPGGGRGRRRGARPATAPCIGARPVRSGGDGLLSDLRGVGAPRDTPSGRDRGRLDATRPSRRLDDAQRRAVARMLTGVDVKALERPRAV